MLATSLDVVDRTIQKTNLWLTSLMEILEWEDRRRAYSALRAVLHALRDRLTVEEVAHLGAQLPMLIRGFYYEGWNPSGKPVRERRRDQFLARIEREMPDDLQGGAESIARAVFTVLSTRIAQGEIEDVKQILPAEVRDLWP